MTFFVSSIRHVAKVFYPLTTNREKAACLIGTAFKVAALGLSYSEYIGALTIPYVGWIHAGLGAASLLSHLAGGLQKHSIGLTKELIETLPLVALGALGGSQIISISKMGLASLISLSTTTGLCWIATPCALAYSTELLNLCRSKDKIAANNQARLKKY